MANDHTVYLRPGNVNQPAQPNTNPSPAESTQEAQGQSSLGTAIDVAVLYQAAKQVRDTTIANIGFITGNEELQEQAEAIVKVGAIAVGLIKAPLATGVALGISTGFEIYSSGITQRRNQYKQQQAQILTGKIAINGGRY